MESVARARARTLRRAEDMSKGSHGGARPGAGRPSREDLYWKPIRRAERKIADRLPEIVDALIDLATGCHVEEHDPQTGQIRRYQARPDREAAKYLIDRLAGRPTEHKKVEGEKNESTIQIFLPDNRRTPALAGEVIDADFSESPSRRVRKQISDS